MYVAIYSNNFAVRPDFNTNGLLAKLATITPFQVL